MNIEILREICNEFPGTTEDIKWGADLCFCVAEKMFLVTGLESVPTGASFKVPPEQFDDLVKRPGFRPAPYLARAKWVKVEDITAVSRREWEQFARQSYELIVAKLPKRVQRELAGN